MFCVHVLQEFLYRDLFVLLSDEVDKDFATDATSDTTCYYVLQEFTIDSSETMKSVKIIVSSPFSPSFLYLITLHCTPH